MTYRSRALSQGVRLKGISRTITMQNFTLTSITDAEKIKLRCKCQTDINVDGRIDGRNDGRIDGRMDEQIDECTYRRKFGLLYRTLL